MDRDSVEQFIESDAEKLGATPAFRGTRVPVKNFFDYLEVGVGIQIFLDDFPTVLREQAFSVVRSINLEAFNK